MNKVIQQSRYILWSRQDKKQLGSYIAQVEYAVRNGRIWQQEVVKQKKSLENTQPELQLGRILSLEEHAGFIDMTHFINIYRKKHHRLQLDLDRHIEDCGYTNISITPFTDRNLPSAIFRTQYSQDKIDTSLMGIVEFVNPFGNIDSIIPPYILTQDDPEGFLSK